MLPCNCLFASVDIHLALVLLLFGFLVFGFKLLDHVAELTLFVLPDQIFVFCIVAILGILVEALVAFCDFYIAPNNMSIWVYFESKFL